jgi:predicted TIM-barrel fold metal-dependent hydrolase
MRMATWWLVSCCLVPWALLHAQEENAAYRGPSIDTHAHVRLGDDDTTAQDHPRGIEALQRLDDAAGVTRSALIVMARKGQVPATRKQNDAVIELARNSQGRFFAVASVHPADGEAALAELSRVAKAGVKVIKLHPNTQGFDVADPAVAAVAQRCGELGLVWTIRKLGMDRILFGSDWPVDTPAVAHEAIAKLGLSAEAQKMVLYDNARQLLGLP